MVRPQDIPAVEWLLLVIQVATLIALIIYVWKTWQMAGATRSAAEASATSVEEMRVARREASDPRLAIYFMTPSTMLAEIIIENAGESTAVDVTFEFSPPLRASQNEQLAIQFFQSPKTIPARAKMRHAFDSWPGYFEAKLPLKYQVLIQYRRIGEDTLREEVQVLDPGSFQHALAWSEKGVNDLATRFNTFADRVERSINEFQRQLRSADHRRELLAPSRPFVEGLRDLLSTVELIERAGVDQHIRITAGLYLPALRELSLAAFLAGKREEVNDDLQAALSDLILSLHHLEWDSLNHQEAGAKLNQAISAVNAAAAKYLASAARRSSTTRP
jgi:hypothetical protein